MRLRARSAYQESPRPYPAGPMPPLLVQTPRSCTCPAWAPQATERDTTHRHVLIRPHPNPKRWEGGAHSNSLAGEMGSVSRGPPNLLSAPGGQGLLGWGAGNQPRTPEVRAKREP